MRILGLTLCLGLFAVPSAAKVKVGIDVTVADNGIKSELKSGLAATFNSTDRYATTESVIETDIVLDVVCVPMKMRNYNLGIICSSEGFYYPFKSIALSHHLPGAGSIMSGDNEDLQRMIKDFANNLIKATTDDKLAEYKKSLMTSVQLLCVSEPGICRPPLPKQ